MKSGFVFISGFGARNYQGKVPGKELRLEPVKQHHLYLPKIKPASFFLAMSEAVEGEKRTLPSSIIMNTKFGSADIEPPTFDFNCGLGTLKFGVSHNPDSQGDEAFSRSFSLETFPLPFALPLPDGEEILLEVAPNICCTLDTRYLKRLGQTDQEELSEISGSIGFSMTLPLQLPQVEFSGSISAHFIPGKLAEIRGEIVCTTMNELVKVDAIRSSKNESEASLAVGISLQSIEADTSIQTQFLMDQ